MAFQLSYIYFMQFGVLESETFQKYHEKLNGLRKKERHYCCFPDIKQSCLSMYN
jgi:hypothetical protein